MDRTAAVRRINDELGFRPDGHSLEAKIILRLQEAQRDLEKGKTLPRFLLTEDATITLLDGAHTAALPADFLRDDETNPLHFTPEDTDIPFFLSRRAYKDAVLANTKTTNDPVAPSVYVIRGTTIDFITTADQDYTLTWNYYGKGLPLTSDIENVWLDDDNMPEYLIGEAGYRIAWAIRDKEASAVFDLMRRQARLAIFGETVIGEAGDGPLIMGANL